MTMYNQLYESEVLDYFAHKADQYDLVEEQVYWRLSDRLLWDVFNTKVLQLLPPNFRFLDAGGGTGRWTAAILAAYPQAQGVLYDLSSAMSQKAVEKAVAGGFADRLSVRNGKLEEVSAALESAAFDLVFNFHNVLGFVQSVETVVSQLAALLKPGGMLLSFVPSKYHNMFFNIFVGNLDEAEQPARSNQGRFTSTMPYMHVFTPSGMRELYQRNGLTVTTLTGFPSLIYPGMQETQLQGSTAALADILSDAENFERIYRLERATLEEPDVVARGNNLFVLGKRQ